MKRLIAILIILIIALPSIGLAKRGSKKGGDVYVDGYFRKDGTYVKPYTRKAPNDSKWDNYGRQPKSKSDSLYSSPYSRDYDKDGIYNQFDLDDDNDGILDDYDKK